LLSLGFDDEPAPAAVPLGGVSAPAAVNAPAADAFDDFDDFQSAPPPPVANPVPSMRPLQTQLAKPSVPAGGANVFDLLNASQTTQSPAVASPMGAPLMNRPSYSGSSMGVGGGMGSTPLMPAMSMTPNLGGRSTPSQGTKPTPTTKATANFDDLWSTSLTSTTGRPAAAAAGGSGMGGAIGGKSIMDLQREKAQAAIWGSPAQGKTGGNTGLGIGGGAPSNSNASSGLDDLLL
jgi:epsin